MLFYNELYVLVGFMGTKLVPKVEGRVVLIWYYGSQGLLIMVFFDETPNAFGKPAFSVG